MKIKALGILVASLVAAAAHAGAPKANEVVDKLESRFQSLTDYECIMESEVKGKKDVKKGRYHFWFKKPEMVRIKVEKGHHSGSQIALNAAGKVRARPGGLLKFIKVPVDKNDKRLRSPRGTYFYDTHMGSSCRRLREAVRTAQNAEVTGTPGGSLQVSLSYNHPQSQAQMKEIWTIDSARWLITGCDVFENGDQVEHVVYRDYRIDGGLEDGVFNL
jgi:outer membrane lipoprotein-sorting protein